jgi:hypothetical protein
MALPVYIKKDLKAKEELMETQIYFTIAKNIIFKKILLKKPKSLKMFQHKPKYHLSKTLKQK